MKTRLCLIGGRWSGSTNIARVDANGLVTAGGREGTATITATTVDGTNLSASASVEVWVPMVLGAAGALTPSPLFWTMLMVMGMPPQVFEGWMTLFAFIDWITGFGGVLIGGAIDALNAALRRRRGHAINNWLIAHATPSASGGRNVPIPSDYARTWFSFEGTAGINALLRHRDNSEDDITVTRRSCGAVVDENGRYWIAAGPRVLNPNYPDTGRLWWEFDGLTFGTKVDVLIRNRSTGELRYIYAVVGSLRAHNFSPNNQNRHGIVHNGIPYPNSWNATNEINPNTGTNIFPADWSSVEFIRTIERTNLNQYEVVRLIVY